MKKGFPSHIYKACLFILFALTVAAAPAFYLLHARAANDLAEAKSARVAAETTLAQLKDNSDAARELKGHINAEEARRVLAPVNRLETAIAIERMAASFHLGHFAYTLAPEKDEKNSDAQPLALSAITLSADAASDTDVFAFIDQIGRILPGRASVENLSVERVDDGSAALSTTNVRFKATLEWLSNGTARDVAEAP